MAIMLHFGTGRGREGRGPSLLCSARRLAAVGVLVASMAASGQTLANAVALPVYAQQAVIDAALKAAVPLELALAVARAGGVRWSHEEHIHAAVGIMGVRASVARAEFGIEAHQLRAMHANAGIGVALLERLYGRHGERWDLALSHYRGGPLVRCGDETIVHAHTIDYVVDVMEWWRRYQDDKTVTALIGDVRRGQLPQDRFKVDGNTLLRVGQESLRYDDGHIPSRGAHRERPERSRAIVIGKPGRFR